MSEEDLQKEKKAAGATMSKQRQIQLMMNKLTLAHCLKQVQHNEQVMVFVHSRKETAATMHSIVELARGNEEEPGTLEAFCRRQTCRCPSTYKSVFRRAATRN